MATKKGLSIKSLNPTDRDFSLFCPGYLVYFPSSFWVRSMVVRMDPVSSEFWLYPMAICIADFLCRRDNFFHEFAEIERSSSICMNLIIPDYLFLKNNAIFHGLNKIQTCLNIAFWNGLFQVKHPDLHELHEFSEEALVVHCDFFCSAGCPLLGTLSMFLLGTNDLTLRFFCTLFALYHDR